MVRALRNESTMLWAGRENELVASMATARAQLDAAYGAKDHTRIHLLAGEGSSRIDSILPAAEIVRSVVAEAELVIRGLQGVVR